MWLNRTGKCFNQLNNIIDREIIYKPQEKIFFPVQFEWFVNKMEQLK